MSSSLINGRSIPTRTLSQFTFYLQRWGKILEDEMGYRRAFNEVTVVWSMECDFGAGTTQRTNVELHAFIC